MFIGVTGNLVCDPLHVLAVHVHFAFEQLVPPSLVFALQLRGLLTEPFFQKRADDGVFLLFESFVHRREAIAFCFLPLLHLGQRGLQLFLLPLEPVHALENVGQIHAGFARHR